MTSAVVNRLHIMGCKVLDRSQWGTKYEALYQKRRVTKKFIGDRGKAKYAFSHISVTRDDGPSDADFAADMRELERIGYERFLSGISYNWAVDLENGTIGEGMPLDAKGTHTVNNKHVGGYEYDLNAYGHAIVGIGMPGAKPTNAFVASVAAIIAAERDLGLMVEDSDLLPHSMFAAKDCPTTAIRNRIPEIEMLVPQIGRIFDMQMSDKVGSIKDPDGSPLVVSEALIRGNWAYMERTGQLDKYKEANSIK